MSDVTAFLTKKQYKHLKWLQQNQPVSLFDVDGPSLSDTKKMVELGLVKTAKDLAPHPRLDVGLSQFVVSFRGKLLLKKYSKP